MNDFQKVIANIKKEYPTVRQMFEHYAQIDFDILFDPWNYMFIGIYAEDGKIILTDNAQYVETCQIEDEDYQNVAKICEKHGLVFNNWHIECDYNSNKDIKKYLDCLYELQEKYAKK